MDDSEEEGMYLSNPAFRSKAPVRNSHSYPMKAQFQQNNAFQREDDQFDDEEDNPGFGNAQNEYHFNPYYDGGPKSNKKRRKMESLPSTDEFAPRAGMNLPKSSHVGGTSSQSWNEEESYVLLEVWGERYLELGRRSLRAEDWSEVSEKVTEMSGREKREIECRNQLDVLKKKYKKERAKLEKIGGGFASKWDFFKKMDVLLNLRMRGHCGLGCGFDSGEYVFMNPHVYLDMSNMLDEMQDSPGQSDEENADDEGFSREEEKRAESARLLTDSIQRFGELHEKIESSKRRQMMELEKMRRDFQTELELQKKQIVERAEAEIAQIRERDDDDEEDDDNDDDNGSSDVPDSNIR